MINSTRMPLIGLLHIDLKRFLNNTSPPGVVLGKRRGFSLYDIEEFLKEVGCTRVSESAVISLEKELEDTVKELVTDAEVYAHYAGRRRLIKRSDVELATSSYEKSEGP
jgi:histone H3/H4